MESPWVALPFELKEDVELTDEVFPVAVPVDYAVLLPKFEIEVAVATEMFLSEVSTWGFVASAYFSLDSLTLWAYC